MQLPKGFVIDNQDETKSIPEGFVIDQGGGFLENVKSDLSKRSEQLAKIRSERQAGKQSYLESELQNTGTVLGGVGDIMGRGMSALAGTAFSALPDEAQQKVKEFGSDLMASRPAQSALGLVSSAAKKYEDFAKKSPRAARNIEAIGNITTSLYPMAKRSKAIGEASESVGKAAISKVMPKPEKLSSEDLRKIGSQLFQEAETTGAIMRPEAASRFFASAKAVTPQTLAGRATAGESPVSLVLKRWEDAGLANQPMSFTALKEMDEELGRLAYESVDNFGKMTRDGKQFLDLQTKLRDAIENAADTDFVGGKGAFETAKEARKYWSAQMRLRDIERIIERGLNSESPATSIKNGFNTLLNSKRFSQYNEAEKAAIRAAAKKGNLVDFLGAAGSRLNQVVLQSVGAATGGVPGAMAGSAAGFAATAGARGLATSAQLKKAKFVADLIRERVVKSPKNPNLTPEILGLLKEVGITQIPAGGASAILDQLDEMSVQQSE